MNLICATISLLFLNTISSAYGDLLGCLWWLPAKCNYFVPQVNNKDKEQEAAYVSNIKTEIAKTNPGKSADDDEKVEPISLDEYKSRIDLASDIIRPLVHWIRIDGQKLNRKECTSMGERVAEYRPSQPVTFHSVVTVDMPRKLLCSLELIEHCKDANSYPLLTTKDIVHCVGEKHVPLSVQLFNTPVNEQTEKAISIKNRIEFEYREDIKKLHNELRNIRTMHTMTVEEYAAGIEAYVGYMEMFQDCTHEDGALRRTLECMSFMCLRECPEKSSILHKGQILASQVKHLIKSIKNLEHDHWRWLEEEKKVISSDVPQDKGELLDNVLTSHLKELEQHIAKIKNFKIVNHFP